ncbi:hypothetical protein D3C84_1034090 [compost metagenome]
MEHHRYDDKKHDDIFKIKIRPGQDIGPYRCHEQIDGSTEYDIEQCILVPFYNHWVLEHSFVSAPINACWLKHNSTMLQQ